MNKVEQSEFILIQACRNRSSTMYEETLREMKKQGRCPFTNQHMDHAQPPGSGHLTQKLIWKLLGTCALRDLSSPTFRLDWKHWCGICHRKAVLVLSGLVSALELVAQHWLVSGCKVPHSSGNVPNLATKRAREPMPPKPRLFYRGTDQFARLAQDEAANWACHCQSPTKDSLE